MNVRVRMLCICSYDCCIYGKCGNAADDKGAIRNLINRPPVRTCVVPWHETPNAYDTQTLVFGWFVNLFVFVTYSQPYV